MDPEIVDIAPPEDLGAFLVDTVLFAQAGHELYTQAYKAGVTVGWYWMKVENDGSRTGYLLGKDGQGWKLYGILSSGKRLIAKSLAYKAKFLDTLRMKLEDDVAIHTRRLFALAESYENPEL